MNMQLIQDDNFNEYINSFKKLKLEDKNKQIEYELKKIVALLDNKNRELGLDATLPYNREILDTQQELVDNDDYAESIFVYVNTIEELLANYINKMEGNWI